MPAKALALNRVAVGLSVCPRIYGSIRIVIREIRIARKRAVIVI